MINDIKIQLIELEKETNLSIKVGRLKIIYRKLMEMLGDPNLGLKDKEEVRILLHCLLSFSKN